MEGSLKTLVIFCSCLVAPVVYYRILVLLFYSSKFSPLREWTGLSIHHYHYGVVLITAALLMLVFFKRNNFAVALGGLGLGLILDTFIPSLKLHLARETEIAAYSQGLLGTIVLIAVLVVVILMFWWWGRN